MLTLQYLFGEERVREKHVDVLPLRSNATTDTTHISTFRVRLGARSAAAASDEEQEESSSGDSDSAREAEDTGETKGGFEAGEDTARRRIRVPLWWHALSQTTRFRHDGLQILSFVFSGQRRLLRRGMDMRPLPADMRPLPAR
jgi:hypothetical protein